MAPGKSSCEFGDVAFDVGVDRLAAPALAVGAGHPVAPDQHLLGVEREARDLPADDQSLEEHLLPARPDVLGRGGILAMRLVDLPDRLFAQRLAEGESV